MKLTWMLFTLAAAAALTGCDATPALLSIEAVATTQDTAIDPALIGAWESADGDGKDTLCVIRRGDPNGYQIQLVDDTSVLGFRAQMFRVGDAELLDLIPAGDNDFRLPGHAVVRVWPNGGGLRWTFLDSDWLKQQAAGLAAHDADGKLLLFSPAATIRALIAAAGMDEKAYTKTNTWRKLQ